MKKHLPNFITSLNILTGSLGCMVILEESPSIAIYFVAICGLFDVMDGLSARLLNVKSTIGKELDSLADVISFGLLPTFAMFRMIEHSGPESDYRGYVAFLIVIFSALRLARFNVDETQTHSFRGLPTPANAVMISSLPFLPAALSPGTWVLVGISLASSVLLVSPLRLIALKFEGSSWSKNASRYLLIIAVLLILGIFQLRGLPWIIPVYLLISIIGEFSSKK